MKKEEEIGTLDIMVMETEDAVVMMENVVETCSQCPQLRQCPAAQETHCALVFQYWVVNLWSVLAA